MVKPFGVIAALGAIAACGGQSTGSATPQATPLQVGSATPTPIITPAPVANDTTRLCKVTATSGGVYYLDVTSATEHDFRACNGAEPYNGTLDTLLAMSGMDRRCILDSNEAIARFRALVGVYSDTMDGNISAARQFCRSQGGMP